MILVIKENTLKEEVDALVAKLAWMNLHSIPTEENGRYYIAIVNGADTQVNFEKFSIFPCVERVLPFSKKFKLASRDFKKERTLIHMKNQVMGGGTFSVIAGPCSIESEDHIHQTARLVAASGAQMLRGGAFKPRTSPYDFQGLGKVGLKYLHDAANKNNLLSVSEVMDTREVDLVASFVDILQVGARNMQNFSLLKEVGKLNKPVLLKRGFSATYMDFLLAAEYILQMGNPNVILCERGIRTFETYSRNTLDIAAVPILHELSHLPIVVDPSHGTGIRSAVPPMAYAAMAAGADGIMVEVHPHPDQALSDAQQTISPQIFSEMMEVLRRIGQALHPHTKQPLYELQN